MPDYPQKEYATGNWNGKNIKFNRNFRGHRFTDDEVMRLCAGQEIEVLGLKSQKTGNEYGVKGKLANLTFTNNDGEDISYIGFDQTGFVNSGPRTIPNKWANHEFTDEEKAQLKAGCEIELTDCHSNRTGNDFSCKVKFDEKEGIVPNFDR